MSRQNLKKLVVGMAIADESSTLIGTGLRMQNNVNKNNGRETVFVCFGNTCRSFMAEYAYRNILKEELRKNYHNFKDLTEQDLDKIVDGACSSRGMFVGADHRDTQKPSWEAVKVLEERGIISGEELKRANKHRPTQLERQASGNKDYIVMDDFLRGQLAEKFPESDIELIFGKEGLDDPKGKANPTEEDYEKALNELMQRPTLKTLAHEFVEKLNLENPMSVTINDNVQSDNKIITINDNVKSDVNDIESNSDVINSIINSSTKNINKKKEGDGFHVQSDNKIITINDNVQSDVNDIESKSDVINSIINSSTKNINKKKEGDGFQTCTLCFLGAILFVCVIVVVGGVVVLVKHLQEDFEDAASSDESSDK